MTQPSTVSQEFRLRSSSIHDHGSSFNGTLQANNEPYEFVLTANPLFIRFTRTWPRNPLDLTGSGISLLAIFKPPAGPSNMLVHREGNEWISRHDPETGPQQMVALKKLALSALAEGLSGHIKRTMPEQTPQPAQENHQPALNL